MDIWIGRNGERHGPYKEADVRQWLRSGEVAGDDLGWHDGLADWQPLSTLFPEELNRPAATTPPPMAAAPLPPTTTVALENYAGFWKRVAAWLLDYILLMLPAGAILSRTNISDATRQLFAVAMSGGDVQEAMTNYTQAVQAGQPSLLLIVLIGFLYYTLMEGSSLQATLGKLAIGIRVTDLHGNKPGMARSAARNVVRLTNAITGLIPFVAYIVAGWTARKQGLHDMLAKTLVLNGRAAEFKQHDARKEGIAPGRFDA